MTRNRLCAALAAAVLYAAAASAQEAAPAAAPDLAKAQQTATSVCAACHGADGNSSVPANPNLAAQGADYITLQLEHFKSGLRVNPIMQPMAASLSVPDMTALGVYFSKQALKGAAATNIDLVKAGQQLWRGGNQATGVPACAACHSPDGAGVPKNYPRLAGQHADYLLAQLQAFKAGTRGNDKAGKDVNGHVMFTIATRMSDAEMQAVAQYAAGLR
ncbi:MAG: c-type cytochrome [Proteobacteria bacterium]|jgi:cytochrome c553|nr:c-type cytochrome [Pseudomonadota bacterium]